MYCRMANRNSSLGHHLLKVAQTQRIRNVSAHAEKDHIKRIVQTPEHLRHSRIQVLLHRSDRAFSGLQHSRSLIATKPCSLSSGRYRTINSVGFYTNSALPFEPDCKGDGEPSVKPFGKARRE